MNKYWFKPHKYGYGTHPVTWQGWLALFFLLILIMTSFFINIILLNGMITVGLKDWLRYGLDVVILAALFHVVFKDKIDGELKWRWGK